LFSAGIDWIASCYMVKTDNKKVRLALLLMSLISNFGLLGFFKYSGFFAANVDQLGEGLGISIMPEQLSTYLKSVVLPVGISFYTFQALSYTIDVYRGAVHRARNFTEFLAFITAFPQLVAGPIVRYVEIEAQMQKPRVRLGELEEGVQLFILGLAKKVLIADSLAPLAETIFDTANIPNGVLNLLGVFAYSLQVYFDFSGYSEMAIGLGLFFGFRFPQNFNSPYKASSMSDFWKRWHMTLSYWFRDYVYIPMGGSRCGPLRRTWNLIASMSICGLWHGAGWNFLLWGTGHGVALVIDKLFSGQKGVFFTFLRRSWCLFVVIALWIPFRAETTEDMRRILFNISHNFLQINILYSFKEMTREAQLAVLVLLPAAIVALFARNVFELNKNMSLIKSVTLALIFIVSVYTLLSRDYIPFLYFQF